MNKKVRRSINKNIQSIQRFICNQWIVITIIFAIISLGLSSSLEINKLTMGQTILRLTILSAIYVVMYVISHNTFRGIQNK
jgi:hypothetical protein